MSLIMGMIALAASASAQPVSLSAAHSLYDRNQVAQAEQMYTAIAADTSASADDRSESERELARVAWLIDRDADRALNHLAKAKALGGKPCDNSAMIARVLREARRGPEAVRREAELIASCDEPNKRDLIRTNLIAARLDLAASEPVQRARLLEEATTEGAKLTNEAGVEGARVRLETALLTDKPDAALAAWKDYFWLDEGDAPQALAKEPVAAMFRDGLAPGASVKDRLVLADLLMRAGFAEPSRRYASAHGLPGEAIADPTWRKLEAYWHERDKLEALLLRVNRGLARGKRDEDSLKAAAQESTIALMKAAGASGEPKTALLRNYGLVGTVGTTSGYPSIHMGHVIEDHDDSVTQYGHTAKIHFMAIDNLIGNGFESWLWDGSAMVGGWTADGVIVHIRPGYVESPSRAYRLTRDGETRREFIGRQQARAAEDLEKLKQRPVATLNGLSDRLQLQLVDQIWAGARSKAADESDVRRIFLAEFSRANLNQSIRVHEGRHAIDEVLGISAKVEQPVLEYRAKLSELALTAYPRMAMRNLNRNLEGDGPHDKAGAKIFDEYRKWIEAHHDQVMGYDPAVPALVQLDKLFDGQIREIAQGLDPLARGEVTSPAKL